jgi:hypothetical protein
LIQKHRRVISGSPSVPSYAGVIQTITLVAAALFPRETTTFQAIPTLKHGQAIGGVEAATRAAAELAATKGFGLDPEQRKRLLLLEYA